MDNQVFTESPQDKNYQLIIVGNLACDNLLFDRTCPTCHKGMYSSRKYTRCPKCGSELGYIMSRDNKPMCISEGTVYPSFGPKRDNEILDSLAKGKNKMLSRYRFKLFNFADEHGVLTPPPEHDRCKTGAKVEVKMQGRPIEPKWFMGKDALNRNNPNPVPWVEIGMLIFTNRGGYVKVLTEQEYASATISHGVQANDVPTPIVAQPTDPNTMQQLDGEIAAMEQRIAAIKAVRVNMATPTPQPSSPPWEGQNQLVSNTNNSVDPFAHA